ncbi:MAG: LpqB family beta-propeller domain-containing protein [Flaviflexus sp.]|nr:LpqB family beta-propeller domain-containing protein [Flaviflexus sp.]
MKRLLFVLAALALVLAGCHSIPQSGPVNATRPPSSAGSNVGLYPTGPAQGASPEEIVRGFLTASAAGVSEDFQVARQYLSPRAAAGWVPLSQVRIYSDSRIPAITRTETGAVQVNLDSQATLDADGRYLPSPPATAISTEFSLAKNSEGEWRIVNLEDGLLVSSTLFSQQYSRAPLYFLSSDSRYLVADLRWLPRASLATSLTKELLAGPSPWLEKSVRTALPATTKLGDGGIITDNGTAQVSLSPEALTVDLYTRRLIQAQVSATLQSVPGIKRVEVTVNGAPLDVGEVSDMEDYPYSGRNLLLEVGGVPSWYSEGASYPLSMAAVPPQLSDLALGYDAKPLAIGLSEARRIVTLPNDGSDSVVLYESAKELIAPSVDRFGWVWSGPADGSGPLIALTRGGKLSKIEASWLDSPTISSIHISREGNRAVVVWHDKSTAHIAVAGIRRDETGRPTKIDNPIDIGGDFEAVADLAWIDATTLVVLGRVPGASDQGMYTVPIGGPITTLPAEVAGAVSLTAGEGKDSIVVATDEGVILERSGGAWQTLITGAADPALAG